MCGPLVLDRGRLSLDGRRLETPAVLEVLLDDDEWLRVVVLGKAARGRQVRVAVPVCGEVILGGKLDIDKTKFRWPYTLRSKTR